MQLYLDRYTGTAQQEICRCLMRLGIPYTLENVVDKVVVVDVVLRLPDHPKIAIKVRITVPLLVSPGVQLQLGVCLEHSDEQPSQGRVL